MLRASKAGRGGRDIELALVNESARAILGHDLYGTSGGDVRARKGDSAPRSPPSESANHMDARG